MLADISIEDTFLRSAFRVAARNRRNHFESISRAALYGFHQSVLEVDVHRLCNSLDTLPVDTRGFGYHGASMGIGLLESYGMTKATQIRTTLAAPRTLHRFMVYFGLGWAVARLPHLRSQERQFLADPTEFLCWIPLVGFGAHQAVFHWNRYVDNQSVPLGFSRSGLRAFDQGIGAALWYGEGASEERTAERIAMFHPSRQSDLWSGLGFGCAYAGEPNEQALRYLREASGPFEAYLAEGATMAALIRQNAGNFTQSTDLACRYFCDLSAEAVASWAERAIVTPSSPVESSLYELWRENIRSFFV